MRSSLRTRLILTFIGLTTIPLLLVGMVFIQRSFAAQSSQVLILQAHVAQKAATEIKAFIKAQEDDLRLLSEVRSLPQLEQAEQIRLLDGLLTRRAEYEEITLLDGQGNELLRRKRLGTVDRLSNRAGLPEFEQPKVTGTTYYSPIEIDEFGEPFITIALPLFDLRSGVLNNVLVARFRFKTVWRLVVDASTNNQIVYVLDKNGRMVAHSNPSVVLQGRQFDLAAEDSFTNGLDGSRVAQAMAQIPLGEETLVVVAEQPASAALNLTYNIILLTVGAVVLGLLAATGLGITATQRIVQPVEALAKTAQIISNGDLSLKADVKSEDEIGQLAENFNKMTSQLKETIDALNQRILEQQKTEIERENLISELETKNAELTQFTYTVSHDLKSPLVTINGYLSYLEQDAASGNMERLKKDTQRIQEAAKKMHALLTDLLELSRIGRMMNAPVDIPFDSLVRDALDLAHGQIEKHNVTIQIQSNLPVVHGDRQRLTEVLQNLLDNATKYIGDQTDPLIEIGQHGTDNGRPTFFVRDNGIGIASEYHDRIFGLFNKLDAQSEGTGIGLALVKRIIEVHGGRIWVESIVGQGSTFYFTLPTK